MISGMMGVGKSSVSRELLKLLPRAVMLDGDWCWYADPFTVTDETRAMVTDNIVCLLGNFLSCTAYENVIFCWVMHEKAISESILSRLDLSGCRVREISLVCSPAALSRRLERDIASGIRMPDVLPRSLERLPLYARLDTEKLDVSDITARRAAELIASSVDLPATLDKACRI